MITIKAKLWLAAIMAASIILPAAVRGDDIKVEVGDRPYYKHGPRYWDHDYEMTWAPGHWDEHHHWTHGMYTRGERRHHDHDHDGDNH